MEPQVVETLPQPFVAFLPRKSNGTEGQAHICGHFGIPTRWSLQKEKSDQPPALRAERDHGLVELLFFLIVSSGSASTQIQRQAKTRNQQ
jgi:hypothetical protein